MADLSWKQTLSISLLTAAITLGGTTYQQAHQDQRADKVSFLDGAQTTAQETSRLMDNGYNALAKLLKGMDQKGWEDFSKGPLDEYMEFRRGWRQQLIAEHFKLSRYFGKDMANELINIDEIDIRPTDNRSSSKPCSRPAKYQHSDIEKLAAEIECHARFMTVKQDAVNGRLDAQQTDELVEALNSKMDLMNETKNLLRKYDKASVSYLRKLDTRLTTLGVSTVTAL
ncbi:hypothetical protein C2E19_16630 [Pseudomonas sp. DTU12.3]|uniref:hypothetical protein n=1 Tax=Pseudomonas sp. DTU12.3 TaxID=2073078 RepID=UPI00101323D6|nr:hypothetical protein [Pseudomonas sp. DTU12.3]QAX85380.1 hypothetical protein C2E19_16630 [Pseudomonas sp. DTU12.3]